MVASLAELKVQWKAVSLLMAQQIQMVGTLANLIRMDSLMAVIEY